MSQIEARLAKLGLTLPPAVRPPPGVVLPFRFVRVIGHRALISGHSPQAADGSVAGPFGKVGRELTVEQGYTAARLTALSMLGSLQRELVWGDDAGARARATSTYRRPGESRIAVSSGQGQSEHRR